MASRRFVYLLSAVCLVGCGGSGIRKFPLREPLWRDPDEHSFTEKPDEYFSPFGWDAADQTIFRPISRFFAVDPAGQAVNVNALDEVPDSSWFENRISRAPFSPAALATGPCEGPAIDPKGPWLVVGAKPDGANPGFMVKDAQGKKYLLKFDGVVEGPRATAADVIGSRLYHAAGYFVPCNRVTYFERGVLGIDPEATADEGGDEVKLELRHVEKVLAKAQRTADGRFRANASLLVEGKPLGPWTYQGTRSDDPNDVVPHEDRRELRGGRVLAAWLNHFDAREQNTLGTWIEARGGGYVRHYMIDFGDCLGSIWEPPLLGRRIGHAYYLDVGDILEDFLTLGLVRRPWDKARFGASGTVFGYFDTEPFEPESWKPGYPNPAFSRMKEHDAAWMARIIAEFRDEHLREVIKTASFGRALLDQELFRILAGRRDKILRRYLAKLSPLARPVVLAESGVARLCVKDLALFAGIARASTRVYGARGFVGDELQATPPIELAAAAAPRVCARLPAVPGASPARPGYLIMDLSSSSEGEQKPGPLRAHLYHLGGNDYRLAGLERPEDDEPPSP